MWYTVEGMASVSSIGLPRRAAVVALCAFGLACGDGEVPELRFEFPGERDPLLVNFAGGIGWQASKTGPLIRMELYRDGLGGSSEVIGVFAADDDSQPWTPTGPTSESCVLKAIDTSDPAVTAVSGVFRTVGPGLYVMGPRVYAPFLPGMDLYVQWHVAAATQASVSDVRIELSRDGGATWQELAASVPVADLGYSWTVTDGGLPLPQPDCQFRVSEVGDPATFDVSLPFAIE